MNITVLMSTYNGGEFLREQLDSIFAQKGVHVRLIARDDGSSDETIHILEEYQKHHDDMIIISDGKNLQACASFLYLIRSYDDDFYFALADQDDIWDADKLLVAVEAIRHQEEKTPDIPVLYYSNLRIVNENNEFSRISHTVPHIASQKYSALIENLATGCTIVYNKKMAQIAKEIQPKYYSMHDVWLYRVAALFGKTIYDFTPHINYRQHGKNIIGASLKKLSKSKITNELKWIFDKKQDAWYTDIQIFYNQFYNMMSDTDKMMCLEILKSKQSIKSKICVIMDKRLKSNSIYRNVKFTIKVLLENE